MESGLSYAILRPAVIFGEEDILINNIAWTLRHLPVLGVFGSGEYRLRPIYVDDLAALAVEQGQSGRNAVIEAVGPETFTYRQLLQQIGALIGCPRPAVSVPKWLGYAMAAMLGRIMGDITGHPRGNRGADGRLALCRRPGGGPDPVDRLGAAARRHPGASLRERVARRRDRQRGYGKL